ncbi:MAG: cupin domain-containing protein [Desulfobulbus sp.]|uniref:cupin domain-containing protein n=1 Tax=Desulfobulbus sp. TaxID=895 RepID=UPI00283C5700|nr:cupin domain-containing protein [Desulfobulbus sp.]MDR2551369.1 cupin domain-containing protein [Desulfobulbus sp.]
MKPKNIRDALPDTLEIETFEDILRVPGVRIERIVSKGQASPEQGWYDQDEHEWVMVVAGKAAIEFADGSHCTMSAGDYLNIPARCRHRVSWTDPGDVTIWLAVFYT